MMDKRGVPNQSVLETHGIDTCIELCIDKCQGKTLEMLESFLDQYHEKGDLSEVQKSTLLDVMMERGVFDELAG